jgi:hypothetical protein
VARLRLAGLVDRVEGVSALLRQATVPLASDIEVCGWLRALVPDYRAPDLP